jgi:hypothetical protein
VQGDTREGNSNQHERRPVVDQSHDRASTPPARGPKPNNNRCANEGANVDAMLTPTHRHLFGGRPITLPLRPCCSVIARSQ